MQKSLINRTTAYRIASYGDFLGNGLIIAPIQRKRPRAIKPHMGMFRSQPWAIMAQLCAIRRVLRIVLQLGIRAANADSKRPCRNPAFRLTEFPAG